MIDIIDQNLVFNQVFLYGSSKVKTKPYKLEHVFSIENHSFLTVSAIEHKHVDLPKDMSILFAKDRKIYKSDYDTEIVFKNIEDPIETKINILNIHFPETIFIIKLVDNINEKVFQDSKSWKKFVSAIGNINPFFKDIAIYGSMKCLEEYNKPNTKKLLDFNFDRGNSARKWGMGTLCNWVKENVGDEKFKSFRDEDLNNKMYNFARQSKGKFNHNDFGIILKDVLQDRYKTTYDKLNKNEFVWYFMEQQGKHAFKWEKSLNKVSPPPLSNNLPNVLRPLIQTVIDKTKDAYEISDGDTQKALKSVITTLENTRNDVGNEGPKKNIINSLKNRLEDKDFFDKLDKTPNVIGISGGVLVLPNKLQMTDDESLWVRPKAVYHSNDYNVSISTDREWEECDFDDPDVKEVMKIFREGYYIDPEDDIDNNGYDKESMDVSLYAYAAGLDRGQKEIRCINKYGCGANFKSTEAALLHNTMGDGLSTAHKMKFLSDESAPVNAPNPTVMDMIGKNYVAFTEGDKRSVINEGKFKWLLSPGEPKKGRDLYGSVVSFYLHAVITCYTNYLMLIESSEDAIWRRLWVYHMKRHFVDNPTKPHEMKKNPEILSKWVNEERIKNAFFRILTHYHMVFINKYGGNIDNVPHTIIQKQTNAYRYKQDVMEQFIQSNLEECDESLSLDELTEAYIKWYERVDGTIPQYAKSVRDKFESSRLKKDPEDPDMFINIGFKDF